MKKQQHSTRVLAIAPSSRGIGFAVLDGRQRLMDWGVKSVKGDKNAQSLLKIEDLIAQYAPRVIVIEDCEAEGSRRSRRIRSLAKEMTDLASKQKIAVKLISRLAVKQAFFIDGGTKYALAKVLSVRFSKELGTRLPPKRRAWMSEDYRMGIFEAVALGVTYFIFKAQIAS